MGDDIEAAINDRQRSLLTQGLDQITGYISNDPRTLTDNLVVSTDLAMFVVEVSAGFGYVIRGKQVLQQTDNASRGSSVAASISEHVVKDGLADKFTGDVFTLTNALRKIEGRGSAWLRKIADKFDANPTAVSILDDSQFEETYILRNGRAPDFGERINGFFKDGHVYLRESSGHQILRIFVHEGTHAVDMGVGGLFVRAGSKWKAKDIGNMTYQAVYKRELRAFRAERLVDGIPHFPTRQELVDHIFKHYNFAQPGDLP